MKCFGVFGGFGVFWGLGVFGCFGCLGFFGCLEQPSVLNKFFFQNYNILPRSGVRAESLRAGSQNMPNFVTFWPTL